MKRKKKVIRIALSGSSGRMGKSLKKLIKKSSVLKLGAQANRKFSSKDWKAGEIDVVLDFSLPALFSNSLKWSVKHKKPFVSGTTGLKPAQKQALKRASRRIPVFYGENMSAGIFLFTQSLSQLVNADLQILIEDIHHKDKKDKPSGTALRLKKSLPPFLQKKTRIQSFRKGKEFGRHRILIKGGEEILTLEHQALNRELFSKGALQALCFLMKKKKGFYQASDLYAEGKLPPLP